MPNLCNTYCCMLMQYFQTGRNSRKPKSTASCQVLLGKMYRLTWLYLFSVSHFHLVWKKTSTKQLNFNNSLIPLGYIWNKRSLQFPSLWLYLTKQKVCTVRKEYGKENWKSTSSNIGSFLDLDFFQTKKKTLMIHWRPENKSNPSFFFFFADF